MPYPFRPSSKKRNTAASRIQRAWRARRKRSTTRVARRYTGMNSRLNYHSFKRTVLQTNLNVDLGAGGTEFKAYAWALDDLTNSSSFTRLWDAYKVSKIKVEFIPVANQSPYTSPTSGYIPSLILATDSNDESLPTSTEALLQRAGSKMKQFSRPQSKTITPCIAGEAFVSQLTQGYTQKYCPWIPTADPSVKLYGLKAAFVGLPSQVINYHMRTTFWFTMKQPKAA